MTYVRTIKKTLAATIVGVCYGLYILWARHESPVIVQRTSSTPSYTASPSTASPTTGNTATPPSTTPTQSNTAPSQYTDGTYTGSSVDAYYGIVEVAATIQGGKITQVDFLQHPDTHRESVQINQQAMPLLQQEAVQSQNAQVDVVSGATYTSEAFQQSLASALGQAMHATN